MTPLRALMRKEFATLFGSPMAYLALTMVALVTALIFFDHLRLYNQLLFVYATTTMGGFETDTIPDYINLWDTVFFPVMEALGLTLLGAVPLVTMRVFAEERARGTDELLLTTHLTPARSCWASSSSPSPSSTLMMARELRLSGDRHRAGGPRRPAPGGGLPGARAPRHRHRVDRPGLLRLHFEPARGGDLRLGGGLRALGLQLGPRLRERGHGGFLDAISLHPRYGASPRASWRSRNSPTSPGWPWSRWPWRASPSTCGGWGADARARPRRPGRRDLRHGLLLRHRHFGAFSLANLVLGSRRCCWPRSRRSAARRRRARIAA